MGARATKRNVLPAALLSAAESYGSFQGMDYAAKKLKKAMGGKTRRTKRNPVEGAAKLSEAFHGRPAQSVTDYEETLHEHAVLADLGKLLSVTLDDGTVIEFSGTRLASNEDGTQLFAVGGDQAIDLKKFDVDPTKEAVVLGTVKHLDYETAKFHLDKADRQKGPYTHRLGEESGEMPLLCYDTVNHLVSLVGGAYHIDVDMDGKYSAGIRD